MCIALTGRWLRQHWTALLLALLLPVALSLRLYGLNWDRGLFFHPDERQILMVVGRLALPQDWAAFLSAQSPLNPAFFAYGSFPIYLLRIVSSILGLWQADWASLGRYYLLGRLLSALFDTCTVYFTHALACKTFEDRRVAILAAALVALTVLHIQLAHFYTVDTLLTLLVLLAVSKALDVARRGQMRDGILLGVLFAAMLATKISALPFAAIVLVAWISYAWPKRTNPDSVLLSLKEAWRQVRRNVLWTFAAALACFILFEPYALIDALRFGQDVVREVGMSQGWFDFPYTRQYAGTWRYFYQARQLLLFGMGLPLGLSGLVGLLYVAWQVWKHPLRVQAVWLCWPLLYAMTQGAAYVKFMRYMLPLTPFLCTAGAVLLVRLWERAKTVQGVHKKQMARLGAAFLTACVVFGTAFYALAFLNIYAQPHPWIQATMYLCEHLPQGATVLTEYWDDPLPQYGAKERGGCPQEYTFFTVDMYDVDSEAGLGRLLDGLLASDCITLSSDRLYAPISRLARRYPTASRYYQQLFAERLGFKLASAPAVYPYLAGVTFLDNPRAGLPLPTLPLLAANRPAGWLIDLGRADESFTVYDHPQPLVFQRVERLSREELRARLQAER